VLLRSLSVCFCKSIRSTRVGVVLSLGRLELLSTLLVAFGSCFVIVVFGWLCGEWFLQCFVFSLSGLLSLALSDC
jgi:hypothetical protein